MYYATTAAQNTAVGFEALKNATTASNLTAVGFRALEDATTAQASTAMGYLALASNVTGTRNSAFGHDAAVHFTGSESTAIGYQALFTNTSGSHITAVGDGSLRSSTSGTGNQAFGRRAGESNTTGDNNTYVGYQAAGNGTHTTGDNCTIVGHLAYPSSNSVSNEVTLGNNVISSLRCNVQTISSLSDGRDKTDVISLPEGLDFINKLRPVKFKWATRDGNGKDGSYEHGFIAQELQTAQKETDADYLGMVMDENPDRLEASYGKLVPILVQAVKELTA